MRFMKIVERYGDKSIININYIACIESETKGDKQFLVLTMQNNDIFHLDGTIDEMFETIKSLGINNE